MLVFESFELNSDGFESERPLFLKLVVLFQADAHVPLVLFVVLGDLGLALLKDFDFKTTLPGPLLSQIHVQLLH